MTRDELIAALEGAQKALAMVVCRNDETSGLAIRTVYATCIEAEAKARSILRTLDKGEGNG